MINCRYMGTSPPHPCHALFTPPNPAIFLFFVQMGSAGRSGCEEPRGGGYDYYARHELPSKDADLATVAISLEPIMWGKKKLVIDVVLKVPVGGCVWCQLVRVQLTKVTNML